VSNLTKFATEATHIPVLSKTTQTGRLFQQLTTDRRDALQPRPHHTRPQLAQQATARLHYFVPAHLAFSQMQLCAADADLQPRAVS